MRVVLPRVILGNRGDIASRWGVLYALKSAGVEDLTVFTHMREDLPDLPIQSLPYGKVRNIFPGRYGRQQISSADRILWAVGLDLQDDSSLSKLMYLWILFRQYRAMKKPITCLFQGAGPIRTRAGKWLARRVLSQVDNFIARDPGTLQLLSGLTPGLRVYQAHDAIFLPGFERDLLSFTNRAPNKFDQYFVGGKPVIGVNLRQWFHFSSRLLPYQFAQQQYANQAREKMDHLLDVTAELVRNIQRQLNAIILLISAYQPGIVPWEDDLPWLVQLQNRLGKNPDLHLTDIPMSIPEYFYLMSRLDAMVGMRLHSSLIALRFGVPSVNISYTLKGRDILESMGLGDYVFDLQQYLTDSDLIGAKVGEMIEGKDQEKERVRNAVQEAVNLNTTILNHVVLRSD